MQLPIMVCDECEDVVIKSHGRLDIETGAVKIISYIDYDVKVQGFPALRKDYDFCSGILKNGDKEVEFCISVDKKKGTYQVSDEELEELKQTASTLFSGAKVDMDQVREKVQEGAAISVPKAKANTKR